MILLNLNENAVPEALISGSPALPGQHLLRLRVVDEDIKQVFLLQHKKVSEAVSFYIGCAPVSSIFSRLK